MEPASSWGNTPLVSVDREIHDLIEKEKHRQCRGIELIAAEIDRSVNNHPSSPSWIDRNAVFGDTSFLAPGGVRIGTPAMTSRGLVEKDFEKIGEFLSRAVTLTLDIQNQYGKVLKDFNLGLVNNKEIDELKADVEKFMYAFEMPGSLISETKND
ncbi:unnamed protein product [Arabidopsis arenosa]|uniref:Serine hydroxymethyltransferase-like domain-containing protein n=1 Tax=Arabidopsis arenosa TaxID=38785 RepID=A0A8S2AZ82_ARAAE|nr:unnamed protein product [Arabidopsis arenosa]